MIRRYVCTLALGATALLPVLPGARADTLELRDGTTLTDCYIRDEGDRLRVWERFEDVGTPNQRLVPRSLMKAYRIDRPDAWDSHPPLADLTVTYIEITPKLAGLHGRVNYDELGRPTLGGGSLPDIGDRKYTEPEAIAKGLKLKYAPGETVTLTAHVKNVGFVNANPYTYTWLIDGRKVASGKSRGGLKEMAEHSYPLKWQWQDGEHTVTFRVETKQKQIATINDEATDPLWGWGFYYVVSPGRAAAWHQTRTAYGTFAFEDYYRWHLDIMNQLFAASIYPSAPNGIRARVRLDRIVYADDPEKGQRDQVAADGIGYHQGGWTWIDDDDRNKTWKPATKEWRNQTEWSLPHELGHQLGLVDYYALDDQGYDTHVMPDNAEKITHFMTFPNTMMHWHGPHIWNETDAGYLNKTWDKPRGHFGDYYFAIPAENYLRVVDVNGIGVPGAKVEIFQRGVRIDRNGQPGVDHGVTYYPVVEDGNFDNFIDTSPVIVGTTGPDGVLRLPNRPVAGVRTLNGYERKPNPFGNINVVGARGLMLCKVTLNGRMAPFWLEITDFLNAVNRGQADRFTITLKTPFGSADSPLPPRNVAVARVDDTHSKVSWAEPPVPRETQYLDRAIGYRVYWRVAADGLNDRPWWPVATLGPDAREFVVDLSQKPDEVFWYSKTNRFAVSTLGERGRESELVEVVQK